MSCLASSFSRLVPSGPDSMEQKDDLLQIQFHFLGDILATSYADVKRGLPAWHVEKQNYNKSTARFVQHISVKPEDQNMIDTALAQVYAESRVL